MAYVCGICKLEQAVTWKCSQTPQCKNGLFVREKIFVPPPYPHERRATGWRYTRDVAQTVFMHFQGGHKPQSTVYINGDWAISPDVSGHGGNNPAQTPCWKAFHKVGSKWQYWGSYNGELEQVDRGGNMVNAQPPRG